MFVAFNCKNGNCQNWFFEREEICKKFVRECYKNSTGQQKNKLGDSQDVLFLNILGRHETGRAQL